MRTVTFRSTKRPYLSYDFINELKLAEADKTALWTATRLIQFHSFDVMDLTVSITEVEDPNIVVLVMAMTAEKKALALRRG